MVRQDINTSASLYWTSLSCYNVSYLASYITNTRHCLLSCSILIMATQKTGVIEYDLNDDEHKQMCSFIQKGFRDSLRKFLEEIATSKSATQEGKKAVLSSKAFNPDPISNRTAPLVLAALEGRIGILQLFLEVFKDVIDVNHGSYIVYPDLYLLDLKQVQGFKTRGVTAVNAACISGLTDILKTLVQVGADLNKADHFGYTPLSNATRYGHVNIVEFLLKKGVNITHKTHDGYTPMHLAALHGQVEVIKLMLHKMIDPLFPDPIKPAEGLVPCPLYLAAARGWQPVVDVFTSLSTCPSACKIDALLLLGAAARMFWSNINTDSRKGVIDLWIEARKISDKRDHLFASLSPGVAYGNRKELINEDQLKALLEDDNFDVESLYQCLIIHERCMGNSNSYNWVFLAGIKMFQRKHYKKAEELWERAIEQHYEIAKQHIGFDKYWQHDLKGSVEYMVQFSTAIEAMVKDGYKPIWDKYIDYALQQLKMGILTCLQTNMLDSSAGILKIYYCLLQIFSCWINSEFGQLELPGGIQETRNYSDTLERVGQSFVATASVLTQSNLLHVSIYPAASLKIRTGHWQTNKRLPGLLKALLDWGAVDSIDDIDHHGDRPLHVAAKLPNKTLREVIVALLLHYNAHHDALNKESKTPAEVFKEAYPSEESLFPLIIPKLSCLAGRVICREGVPYKPEKLSAQENSILRFHSYVSVESLASDWITLPKF